VESKGLIWSHNYDSTAKKSWLSQIVLVIISLTTSPTTQPRQSCLDAPPHSLVSPSSSSSLLHSLTPGSKRTFSTNPSHLNRLLLPIGLPLWKWDWTGLIMLIIHQFIFSFSFFIFCSFRVVDYPSAFYCMLNTQYRIVSTTHTAAGWGINTASCRLNLVLRRESRQKLHNCWYKLILPYL